MNNQLCRKCGGVISNDFNHTLSFCTNCGASLDLAPRENPFVPPTILSPKPTGAPATTGGKNPFYLLVCLVFCGAAIFAGLGYLGYRIWTAKPAKVAKIPRQPNAVRFLSADFESLDPHRSRDAIVVNALFDALTEYKNQSTDPSPSLAASWESSADASVWTFRLRADAKWSDGSAVRAHDFVYSWRRVLDPDFDSSEAILLYPIKNAGRYNNRQAAAEEVGVEAIDDYTLKVTLERPAPFFPKLVAQTVFRPVPRAALEKHGANWTNPENIVSSGAFKLSEQISKDRTVLERNPMFWDNANTRLEKIVFVSQERFFKADTPSPPIVELYDRDEFDAAFKAPLPGEKLDHRKDFTRTKMCGIEHISFNTTLEPFKDARVRRAFNLAIDRREMTEADFSPFPTASFVPEILRYANAKGEGYDPEQARKLLAAAGYPEGRNFPEIEFIYNTNERNRALAEFLQAQWSEELGVKVKLFNLDFKDFFKKRKALDFRGIARGGWLADVADPVNFLELLSDPKNDAGWNDAEFNRLLEKAAVVTDEAERYRILHEAETRLLREQPVIPLWISASGLFCRTNIKNLRANQVGNINWREVFVEPDDD